MQVLTLRDQDKWDAYIQQLPYDLRDVTITSAYMAAIAGDDVACLAVHETDEYFIAQSFLMCAIPDSARYDVRVISGPMSSALVVNRIHGADFQRDWFDYLVGMRAVSEFCLLQPMFEANQLPLLCNGYLPVNLHHVPYRPNAFMSVNEWAFLTRPHQQKQYQDVKAAQEAGYALMIDGKDKEERVRAFYKLYTAAMERHAGAPRWRWSLDQMDALAALGDRFECVLIGRESDEPVAGALFVYGNVFGTYLLAANEAEPVRGAAASAVLAGAFKAKALGCKWLALGGGRTNDEADSLYAFKRHLGDFSLMTWGYQRILDAPAYESLVARDTPQFDGTIGALMQPPFFPEYRWRENA